MKNSIRTILLNTFRLSRFPLLLAVGFVSCGQIEGFDSAAVICPPEIPGALGGREPEFWDLSWLTDDGSVRSRRVANPENAALTLSRERPVILKAGPGTPGLPRSYRIRPAGCIISAHREGLEELELNWEDGFAADFLLRMAGAGIDPARININRFREAVAERSESSPWYLDLKRLGSDLANGDLWIYSFKPLPVFDVVLPLSSGSWYSSYPPDPVIIAGESGEGWSGMMPVGMHRFLRLPDEKAVTVSVDERGDVILLYDG